MRYRFGTFLFVLLAVALAMFASLPAQAQVQPRGLDGMDIFNLQYAADPQISPDAKRIVYVRRFADVMSDKDESNLWIINFDGSGDRPLTTGNFSDSSPRWSPDGTRIAYISDRDGKPQIYVRWTDTGQTAKITNLESAPSNISWSPDGKLIAFTSLVKTAPPEIAAIPAPPQGAKWADPPKIYGTLIYRFNGMGYLPYGHNQLFVISADGGAPRQVSTGNFPAGNLFGGSTAVWTPDSQSLIVSANRREDYEYEPLNTEIYEFSLVNNSVTQLTHRNGPDNSPVVSPDGKLIAYTGFDDRSQGHQTTYLYLMNHDGSNPHAISSKLDRDAESPRWAPDGSGVYFMYDDEGDTKLGFCSLNGACKKLEDHLASGGSTYSGGNAFSIARDGSLAFTHGTPSDPGDLASAAPGGAEMRVLTNLDANLFAQRKIGSVEELWVNSSFDKRRIEAWIVKPPDFDPAKKYPLILEIHGGPFADYGDRFDIIDQIWAAKGYVVVYANPRGSTSYGEEFANLIHHAYPGNDFYDLNSVVDAVEAKGYVDKDNEFVTGGSGGGVLTAWMIEHTNRFRAAACLYPVINWESWVLTSDLPTFGIKYWFPGYPWDYPENYAKRSLLTLVKNVKTPTMLMTGEEDFRTPLSEAEQYYTALKLLHVEAALVRVPGEPHGVSRRPSHMMTKTLYVLGWFEKHMQH